ncbi:MAG: hypothetical protein RLZZ528_1756, partial [Pseudomonadota bacterium]
MWLLLAFVAVPLIEIALFIKVGGLIGLWPTLFIVLATGIAGSWLIRHQGASTLADIQSSFGELRDPTMPLAHGALILVAGVLLLSPGFFTDTLGLLLLLPPVRALAIDRIRARMVAVGGAAPRDPFGGPA